MSRVRVIECLAITAVLAVIAANIVPNYLNVRYRGQLTGCKSNLKNIGTACEMYFTDHGTYPENLSLLTPEYLKSLPECRGAGIGSYTQGYSKIKLPARLVRCKKHGGDIDNHSCKILRDKTLKEIVASEDGAKETQELTVRCPEGGEAYEYVAFVDSYFTYCHGEGHSWTSVPQNYPQYNGVEGLIER